MSDIMRPMKFDHLMNWILGEYETQKTIFGVRAFAKTYCGILRHRCSLL